MTTLDELSEIRARRPEAITEAAAGRSRRPLLAEDGRLLLLAGDHPARGSLGVADRAGVMGDRLELLRRLQVALAHPKVDGVLATPDVIEDLLLLGALENKVVVGSMNRGGLHGASFEMDDRFTAYDAGALAASSLDGGKMLCRIDFDSPGSLATLAGCASAVDELAAAGLMAMVEPFISRRVDGRVRNDLSTDAVIKSVAIAAGLGATSRHTWLKLPVVADMERVIAATTLPTLLLGGDPSGPAEETYAKWKHALALPGVRGLVAGRSLLYPPDDDVRVAVGIAASLVRPDEKG